MFKFELINAFLYSWGLVNILHLKNHNYKNHSVWNLRTYIFLGLHQTFKLIKKLLNFKQRKTERKVKIRKNM